jgi:hypothetical protein
LAQVTIAAPDLARALGNALAFQPAKNIVPYSYLRVAVADVTVVGSQNDHVIGTDEAPVIKSDGIFRPTASLLSKDGLTTLERAAREAKKSNVVLGADGQTVSLYPFGETKDEATVEQGLRDVSKTVAEDFAGHEDGPKWIAHYEAILDMFDEIEKRDHVLPPDIILDLRLASPFTKIKADKNDRMAHLLFGDGYDPVFIKIGPTFRGMWVPIEPETHEKNVGPEGLW